MLTPQITQPKVDTSDFLTASDLPTSLLIYPTTASSPVSGYYRLVTNMSDPDYDDPAVDVATGAISGTGQLISSLATDEGIVVGDLGIFNVNVIGNIRKTAGATSTDATFYFEVYKRESSGTETLIATSDSTQTVSSASYEEFFATALFNDGTFLTTDRLVLKFYGTKVGGGVAPQYDFQFGGISPVRVSFPVPVGNLLNGYVANSFETFSKNLKAYPYEIAEVSSTVTTLTYDTGAGDIIKTITEVSPTVTTIVFSGAYTLPITTKTITEGATTVITYS